MSAAIAGAIITAAVALIIAVVAAAWKLSSVIATNHTEVTKALNERLADMTAQIAKLNTDLAVMREREEQRAEKISRMWDWWIRAIEMGFLSGSKQRSDDPSTDILKGMHP